MITKNFRLNALVNQYAVLHEHITIANGDDYFMIADVGSTIGVNHA